MLLSLAQLFHPLPLPDSEDEFILHLKNLYLSEENIDSEGNSSVLYKDHEMRSRVCGTVLTSYDMSLRDTMQLTSSKLGMASALVKQLGGKVETTSS